MSEPSDEDCRKLHARLMAKALKRREVARASLDFLVAAYKSQQPVADDVKFAAMLTALTAAYLAIPDNERLPKFAELMAAAIDRIVSAEERNAFYERSE